MRNMPFGYVTLRKLLSALTLLAGFVNAQLVHFEKFSIEQGLSHPFVTAIVQDSLGFMWFGTQDGLNRYDGYTFKVYRHDPDNATSISANHVISLTIDHRGIIWIGTRKGFDSFNPRTEAVTRYSVECLRPETERDFQVFSVCEYPAGNIWFGTRGGLGRLNVTSGDYTVYQHPPDENRSMYLRMINDMFVDDNHQFWIAGYLGLSRYDAGTDSFMPQYFSDMLDPATYATSSIRCIDQDKDGNLWVGTRGGLQFVEKTEGRLSEDARLSAMLDKLPKRSISAIYYDSSHRLWISFVQQGLFRIDLDNYAWQHFQHDPTEITSIGSNDIASVYEDRSGQIWIGSSPGLNLVQQRKDAFQHFKPKTNEAAPRWGYQVLGISYDPNHLLWIGTWDGGLFNFDIGSRQFRHFEHLPVPLDPGGSRANGGILFDGKNNRWIKGGNGLQPISAEGQLLESHYHDPNNANSLSHNHVTGVLDDGGDILWITTAGGLNRWDRRSGIFTRIMHDSSDSTSIIGNYVRKAIWGADGKMWLAIQHGGLSCLDTSNLKATNYTTDLPKPYALSNSMIYAMHFQSPDSLWLGTNGGGLNLLHIPTGVFTIIREKDGLANDVIYSIEADNKGRLWMGTNMGLCVYDPKHHSFRGYTYRDGIQGNDFNHASCIITPTGEMAFGGTNGFMIFHPDSVKPDSIAPEPVFTNLSLANTPVVIAPGEAQNSTDVFKLRQSISYTDYITLLHSQSIFTLEFAALHYADARRNQYAYRLDGFNDEWIYNGQKRDVTFTNLDPGEYVLHVKAANLDGIWSSDDLTLNIEVLPPWWRTNWAYTLWTLLLATVIVMIRRFENSRRQLKHDLEIQNLAAENLRKLDQMKSGFFAKVSHELRTPLTLIKAPLEKLIDDYPEEKQSHFYRLMLRNTQHLLHLVEQLLNYAKLDSGSMKTSIEKIDTSTYFNRIFQSFESAFSAKSINFRFVADGQASLQSADLWADPDLLRQIVYNLLSNALKYTPVGGSVEMKFGLGKPDDFPSQTLINGNFGFCWLAIKDNGIGIAAAELQHIWDPFYRANHEGNIKTEGTGIGLALARELARLHHGDIIVNSNVGEGSVFLLWLPLGGEVRPLDKTKSGVTTPASFELDRLQHRVVKADVELKPAAQNPLHLREANKSLILIVEDNHDLRGFMREDLISDFLVEEAVDGEQGYHKAISLIPDLIISDVMMPRMDGITLCAKLNDHELTNHIPLVLLTAKGEAATELEGLQHGAVDFVAKPFSQKALRAKLDNWLEKRRRFHDKLRESGALLSAPSGSVSQLASPFTKRALKILGENFSDSSFGVNSFADALNLERSQLHRKTEAAIGIAPGEWIRGFRLYQGKELLLGSEESITQIAFRVGFESLEGFSRAFKSHFGISPSVFRNQNH